MLTYVHSYVAYDKLHDNILTQFIMHDGAVISLTLYAGVHVLLIKFFIHPWSTTTSRHNIHVRSIGFRKGLDQGYIFQGIPNLKLRIYM